MTDNRYCVIMAGGTANHFWPISRESRPKQFLDIAGGGKSFLRMTFERFSRIIPLENILVVTLDRFGNLVKEQLPELPENNLLLEPHSRNTAPCIAYSTFTIVKRNPDAIILTTPADHIISDETAFREAVDDVIEYATKNNALMTMGISPTGPDTGYGYIQVTGGKAGAQSGKPVKVKTFTEKPDKDLAEVFYNSGEFFWNSGIFAWKASVILEEMTKHLPDVVSVFKGWEDILGGPGEKAFLEKAYSECPKISIDYGVMEKTDIAWLYSGDFGWSDIDGWESLFKTVPSKDIDGNATNSGKNLFKGDEDNLVVTENKKKIYAIKGLRNYLVIDTDDALLICPKDDKQFKEFIAGLGMPGYEEFR
ncbi:MAG: mannose-1-phosphate guanylyltransferase [Bacteroidales bacterium]|nr:mannose-1-phosphate guanylyltransferase [Bacteroidales bacterium]